MMSAYNEAFPVGTTVQVLSREQLNEFRKDWRYHHKLSWWQVWRTAGRRYRVGKVFFYHGGDVLYRLDHAPGIWHEQCLTAAN
jgi:hypothetical protein